MKKEEEAMVIGSYLLAASGVLLAAAAPAWAGWPGDPAKCKADAVKAGSVCMDKYEASVWSIPSTNTALQLLGKWWRRASVPAPRAGTPAPLGLPCSCWG